jgi:hypothetical protein
MKPKYVYKEDPICYKHLNTYCYCSKRTKSRHLPYTNFAANIATAYPYGYHYDKSHKYVCWNCKKIQKYKNFKNEKNIFIYDFIPNCSLCHNPVDVVGEKFRPPKQNDIKGWDFSKKMFDKYNDVFTYNSPSNSLDDLPDVWFPIFNKSFVNSDEKPNKILTSEFPKEVLEKDGKTLKEYRGRFKIGPFV